jgi:hypothetical protein
MRVKRLVLVLSVLAVLVVASDAPGGGISDEPCPNVAGEYTNTCPSGTLGTPYSIRFVERADSGCGPGRQTFYVDSGIAPPGLTLETNGVLSGTPVQPGRFQFYVEMREPQNDPNCAGERTQKQFTLRIRTPVSVVSAPVDPVRSEVGVPLRTTLRAKGGTGIFAWTLVEGALPAGVRLTRSGAITGAPGTAGTYGFTARVRDTEKRSVSWRGTLRVAPELGIRTERLRAARVGRVYRADLRAAGGVGPWTWKLVRGRLPRGLRLATAAGRLVGVPKQEGRYRVTIAVRDDLEARSTRTFTIVVHAPVVPSRRGAGITS